MAKKFSQIYTLKTKSVTFNVAKNNKAIIKTLKQTEYFYIFIPDVMNKLFLVLGS